MPGSHLGFWGKKTGKLGRDLRLNEVLHKTNDILRPGQSYSKRYGIEPRYNEYNEFFGIMNITPRPKRKIYHLDITNYHVNTRQKIDDEHLLLVKKIVRPIRHHER